jgi:hypothetical protein
MIKLETGITKTGMIGRETVFLVTALCLITDELLETLKNGKK